MYFNKQCTLGGKFHHGALTVWFWFLHQIKEFYRPLNLLWGVKGIYYNKLQSTDKTVEDVNALALKNRYVKKGYCCKFSCNAYKGDGAGKYLENYSGIIFFIEMESQRQKKISSLIQKDISNIIQTFSR